VSRCFFVAAHGLNSRKGDSLFTGFASRKWDKQKLGAKLELLRNSVEFCFAKHR